MQTMKRSFQGMTFNYGSVVTSSTQIVICETQASKRVIRIIFAKCQCIADF
jgi:hypothetical protein